MAKLLFGIMKNIRKTVDQTCPYKVRLVLAAIRLVHQDWNREIETWCICYAQCLHPITAISRPKNRATIQVPNAHRHGLNQPDAPDP